MNNLATLVWLAQLADIEMHPWLSRTAPDVDGAHLTTDFGGSRERIESSALNHPDFIVFDLDPYIYSGRERKGDEPELNKDAFLKTVEVALALKDILDDLSLSSFLKTSGKTGLHIYLPVLRQYDYKVTRKACETIGHFLMRGRPRDVFDLDPYIYSGRERKGDEPELNRDAFLKTVEVALALKDILDDLSLSSFLKTSGKTGLHIYLPVLRQYDYKVTRKACETIGRFLMRGCRLDSRWHPKCLGKASSDLIARET